MEKVFNYNINQILAAYMYAKKDGLDLPVSTTKEEIKFIANEFEKYLQEQQIQCMFFNYSYEIDSNYYCETQSHYIIPIDINSINYFVCCVLSMFDTKSFEILWNNVNNGFFCRACIKWKKKQLEKDIEIVNNLEKKYNQVFGNNTIIQKKLTDN